MNSSYSLVGGGNELWGAQDEGLFGFYPTNGNFDVRVRVESLENVHRYAKTGLMVRESLSSTARMVSLFATPTGPTELPPEEPIGENEVEFNFRRGTGDGSNNINLGSPGYPNAWLRLARRGNIVYGLVSRDGVNWTKSASVDTSTWTGGALRPNVLLGIGSSSHDDGKLVRSELRDFSAVTASTIGNVAITTQPTPSFGVVDSTAKFSVAISDPVDAQYQWFANGVLIPDATNAVYATAAITEALNDTSYTVRITGANGSSVTSTPAKLTVVQINPPAFAGFFADFDGGELPLGSRVFGNSYLDPALGSGGSGGLVLIGATNQQNGSFVVEDFSGFLPVDSFTVAFKLKIGPGSAKPADGFSFSFGTNVPAGLFPSPQQGVGPGLAVSFDIYDNGDLEAPAIDVFYGVDPSNTPANYKGNIVHHRLSLAELLNSRYVDVIIRMNQDGKLDLLWDGRVIAYQVQTPFTPTIGGRFGFGAYAGGQNAFHAIDDLQIETTTLSGGAFLSSIAPLGNNTSARTEIRVVITDQDTSLDQSSVVLKLNDTTVTPTFTRDEDTLSTIISHTPANLLPANSQNTISIVWSDTAGTRKTNNATFRVGNYDTVPSSIALPVNSGVSTDSGFKVKVYQITGNLTATSAFAETVLAGQQGENMADTTIADENGYFVDPSATSTIDYNLNSAPLGTSTFPGIPGFTDSEENFVVEATAYLEFPAAGYYQMGVRTDDGFILYGGLGAGATVLGAYEGEREPSDTIFGFVVPQAGVYPFRLVYYQARGGGLVRWFSLTPSGEQVLINDPGHPLGIRAYRTANGTATPRATITVTRNGNAHVLNWTGGGTLESSTTLAPGSWQTVQGAATGYVMPATGTAAFYRVRQ
ncbi:MAG TPA: PA14 domain-containing protein [Verrucomicrobiae bacterium]